MYISIHPSIHPSIHIYIYELIPQMREHIRCLCYRIRHSHRVYKKRADILHKSVETERACCGGHGGERKNKENTDLFDYKVKQVHRIS